METWFKDYFYKAFDWGVNHASAVETTKVSLILCELVLACIQLHSALHLNALQES
jgi:hypothetical protein